MRKIDKVKSYLGKAAKTINFDKIVLERLEEKAKKEHRSVSDLVNLFVRRIVMTDDEFYSEMSRLHYIEFQHYQILAGKVDEVKVKKNV